MSLPKKYRLHQTQRKSFLLNHTNYNSFKQPNELKSFPLSQIKSKLAYRCALTYCGLSQQILYKYNHQQKQQIASLTKIMTCWITIKYIRQYNIIPEYINCYVSKQAADMIGTTSQLEEGDIINLWDLLHGLMLPSGNDAAVCIAENIGKRILQGKSRLEHQNNDKNSGKCVKYMKTFVEEMNKQAQRLNMVNTKYSNPHGLQDSQNYSTCLDLLLLIKQAVKDELMCKIVKKKLYFCSLKQKSGWTREILWENTNRLLIRGYQGIKTGNTLPAGYCLASWYKNQQQQLFIIVLGSKSKDQRDNETIKLTNLSLRQLKKQLKKKQESTDGSDSPTSNRNRRRLSMGIGIGFSK